MPTTTDTELLPATESDVEWTTPPPPPPPAVRFPPPPPPPATTRTRTLDTPAGTFHVQPVEFAPEGDRNVPTVSDPTVVSV